MPIPRLHHPVIVTIEPIDRTDSVYDPYLREPVGQVVREGESTGTGDQVTIKAQISFYSSGFKQDYGIASNLGIDEETKGYIACRYKDLISAGLVEISNGVYNKLKINRGDRIVQMGKQAVNYYIVGYKPFAHYPKLAQTMIEIDFEDRHPTDQQGSL